jgi:hypothetical protein
LRRLLPWPQQWVHLFQKMSKFNKFKAIKFYGITGDEISHSFYWFGD